MLGELSKKKYRPSGEPRLPWLSRGHLPRSVAGMLDTGSACVRIHDAGDFLSEEYLLAWLAVASRTPDVPLLLLHQGGRAVQADGRGSRPAELPVVLLDGRQAGPPRRQGPRLPRRRVPGRKQRAKRRATTRRTLTTSFAWSPPATGSVSRLTTSRTSKGAWPGGPSRRWRRATAATGAVRMPPLPGLPARFPASSSASPPLQPPGRRTHSRLPACEPGAQRGQRLGIGGHRAPGAAAVHGDPVAPAVAADPGGGHLRPPVVPAAPVQAGRGRARDGPRMTTWALVPSGMPGMWPSGPLRGADRRDYPRRPGHTSPPCGTPAGDCITSSVRDGSLRPFPAAVATGGLPRYGSDLRPMLVVELAGRTVALARPGEPVEVMVPGIQGPGLALLPCLRAPSSSPRAGGRWLLPGAALSCSLGSSAWPPRNKRARPPRCRSCMMAPGRASSPGHHRRRPRTTPPRDRGRRSKDKGPGGSPAVTARADPGP